MADSSEKGISFNKQYITIILWIVLFIASSSGSARLSDSVESAQGFLDEGTESGQGLLIYESRFNITGDVNHIIVLHVPEGNDALIGSDEWQQFTFAMTRYLKHILVEEKGFLYDTFISQPELLSLQIPGIQERANSLVSEDNKTTMINILSSTYNFEQDQQDISFHVEFIRDLLADLDKFYVYAMNITNVPKDFGTIPSKQEVENIDILLTGPLANFVDTIEVTEQSFRDSEFIAIILIVVILALVFRSPMGIVIPVLAMIMSLTPTFMIAWLLGKAGVFQISDFLPSMISMIGIAVAVDYNLFSLVRFREEFRKRKAKHLLDGTWDKFNIKKAQVESARKMNATAGQAVMYSGFAVIIGFMSMLVVGSDFSKSMSISIAVMVIFSILSARTLTPAILGIWGNKIDWPNKLSRGEQQVEKEQKEIKNEEVGESFWVKWSRLVMKFPVIFLLIGLLIMTPFIVLSADTDLSFDTLKSLPPGTESREGLEYVQNNFNLGEVYPYQVIVDAGETGTIFQEDIINAANLFAQWAFDYRGSINGQELQFTNINSVSFTVNSTGLHTMNLAEINNQRINNQFFVFNTGSYVNYAHGNNTMVMLIGTNIDPGTSAAWDLTTVIRRELKTIFGNVEEADTYVTGFSPLFLDTNNSLYDNVPLMIIVAVVLIYLALLVLFRSIILPAKAIITIGGSILFGLGTLVYVLQRGNLLHVGLPGTDITFWEAEQSGVAFIIPIFLFTTVLGLGMDYSIFIITRINEEFHANGRDINEAVGLGLAKTAGVITSAATIMTTTFLVFAASPTLIMKSIGLALSVAIIIDATVSRVIILPAAMRLAGKWNWWLPKWLDKILPDLKLEH